MVRKLTLGSPTSTTCPPFLKNQRTKMLITVTVFRAGVSHMIIIVQFACTGYEESRTIVSH